MSASARKPRVSACRRSRPRSLTAVFGLAADRGVAVEFMTDISPADDIKSLRHGLQVLELLGERPLASSGDVARACDISRAAAYRILQTLCDEGYLARNGAGNQARYELRQRVRELTHGYPGTMRLIDIAIPLMMAWTRQHGWPLALSTPQAEKTICRFTTDSAAQRVLVRFRAGVVMVAPMSAAAMLCLAYQPVEVQALAIRSLPGITLPPYAPRLTASQLASCLEKTRDQGFATFHPSGLREASLAVPVRIERRCMASLGMRYMNVAEGGAAGHRSRLQMLNALAQAIADRC